MHLYKYILTVHFFQKKQDGFIKNRPAVFFSIDRTCLTDLYAVRKHVLSVRGIRALICRQGKDTAACTVLLHPS